MFVNMEKWAVLFVITLALAACNDGAIEFEGGEGTAGDDTDSDSSTDSNTSGDGDTDTDSDADTDSQTTNAVCGDGFAELGEVCDDGGTEDGDGCSGDCLEVDPDYDCSVEGEPCVKVVICGNGTIEGAEVCDPGEFTGGCAEDCKSIDDGWACSRPGKACVQIPECGNGKMEFGETCDSGAVSDPGCVECQIQAGYFCAVPGEACWPEECGNGFLTPGLECDDGNTTNGDGCSNICEVEDGFRCNIDGCLPICGDGLVRGNEQCDDNGTVGGDGCSAGCRVEPGFDCPTEGSACVDAVCPNNKVEAGEGCDDNNDVSGDGCSATCQKEPTVTVGPDPTVNVACGDGLITGAETCDDGNKEAADGCSAACKVETGFTCQDTIVRPAAVKFAVTYRDFKERTENSGGGHPHMKESGVTPPTATTDRGITGQVCKTDNTGTCGRLDDEGKPVLDYTSGDLTTLDPSIWDHPEDFSMWYRDQDNTMTGTNGPIEILTFKGSSEFIPLVQQGGTGSDTYAFDSSSFYPLNDRGHGATDDYTNNYHFTTELRYFFQYQGGEELIFRGDDDVFVYINGRLAIDLGGIHAQQWARVILGDDGNGDSTEDSNCPAATGNATEPPACTLTNEELADADDDRFGITRDGVYEIVLFHAERQPTGSNFRLTLSGFLAPRSFCEPICGDGLVVGTEVCDDGADNNDGEYGVCNETCSAIQYCGDAVKQDPPEACDNGFNITVWDVGTPGACAPECKLPGNCGDGIVQDGFELCDEGGDNDDDLYEGCNTDCAWGPFCGDGTVQDVHEACDDGFGTEGNVSYFPNKGRCGYDCQPAPWCGDGERNGPETCDLGDEENTGEYGGCKSDCTLAPHCGDKIVQKKFDEECDAGPQGSTTCTVECRNRTEID